MSETASHLSSQDSGVANISQPMTMLDVDDDDTLTLTYLVEKTPRKGLGVALQGSHDGFQGCVGSNDEKGFLVARFGLTLSLQPLRCQRS